MYTKKFLISKTFLPQNMGWIENEYITKCYYKSEHKEIANGQMSILQMSKSQNVIFFTGGANIDCPHRRAIERLVR